jgi:putative aldouronate transport system permease protein
MHLSRGERIFNWINLYMLAVIGFIALYPFLYVLTISLSTPEAAADCGLCLIPTDISFRAYEMVLTEPNIRYGYLNTLLRTIIGTLLTLLCTSLAAYPLSRKNMPWRKQLTFFVLVTLVFNGGIVPRYLLVANLGLINSLFALILPVMVTAFNVIVLKNFFQAIPDSFEESARIDGAGDFTILFRIFVPLSKPALATIALWTSVFHWNSWFDALIYITDDKKQVLQLFLQRIVIENSTQVIEAGLANPDFSQFSVESLKAATVVITIVPILCCYPFLQRYFVKGIMLGGVKE